MEKQILKTCDECGSLYFAQASKMAALCPECAHQLYGYENCAHIFVDGRCSNCYWDGSGAIMTRHRLHCQEPWFSFIRQGIKRVEGRKNSPKYQTYKPGDTIVFFLDSESFEVIIECIRHYASLEDYLKTEGVENVLPGVTSLDAGVKTYLQWNTRTEIEKYGFLAIQVRKSR